MGKVTFKIAPSLAGLVNAQDTEWFVLEKEFKESATIEDILAYLASRHTGFRKGVFDLDSRTVGEGVIFVLNDSLLVDVDILKVKLKDNDTLSLFPEYTGG